MPFEVMMNESFTVICGETGKVKTEDLKGRYSEGTIITLDANTPITTGDHILRPAGGGQVEDYTVTDPAFHKEIMSFPDHYQMKVRRTDQPEAPSSQIIQHIVNNVSGLNARVNIGSIDNSTNFVSNIAHPFQEMREVAQANIQRSENLIHIIERIDALEVAANTPNFTKRYNEFISAAASHMTIFTPFIPALTKMLQVG